MAALSVLQQHTPHCARSHGTSDPPTWLGRFWVRTRPRGLARCCLGVPGNVQRVPGGWRHQGLVKHGAAFAKVGPRQCAEAESLGHRDAEAQSGLHRGVEAQGSLRTCQGPSRPPRQGPMRKEAAGGAGAERAAAPIPPDARPSARWGDCSSVGTTHARLLRQSVSADRLATAPAGGGTGWRPHRRAGVPAGSRAGGQRHRLATVPTSSGTRFPLQPLRLAAAPACGGTGR